MAATPSSGRMHSTRSVNAHGCVLQSNPSMNHVLHAQVFEKDEVRKWADRTCTAAHVALIEKIRYHTFVSMVRNSLQRAVPLPWRETSGMLAGAASEPYNWAFRIAAVFTPFK